MPLLLGGGYIPKKILTCFLWGGTLTFWKIAAKNLKLAASHKSFVVRNLRTVTIGSTWKTWKMTTYLSIPNHNTSHGQEAILEENQPTDDWIQDSVVPLGDDGVHSMPPEELLQKFSWPCHWWVCSRTFEIRRLPAVHKITRLWYSLLSIFFLSNIDWQFGMALHECSIWCKYLQMLRFLSFIWIRYQLITTAVGSEVIPHQRRRSGCQVGLWSLWE